MPHAMGMAPHATALKSPVKSPINTSLSDHGHSNSGFAPAHCTVTKSWRPLLTSGGLTSTRDSTHRHLWFELSARACLRDLPTQHPQQRRTWSTPPRPPSRHHRPRPQPTPDPSPAAPPAPLAPLAVLPIECVSRHQPFVSRPSKFWT